MKGKNERRQLHATQQLSTT
ncbi:hypothetical protein E2C01_087021 [Portunus trituberculatus]|uniref:Uncharacterized protein n=1 Tax=Portunus trituberculatus TaxID=210409 RepID=A0A5B7JBA1_PORTR|nr:hypothetical protein [Portunus trituberculatus]